MSYFLFVDESGHDKRESPYEVLAGLAVEDRELWNMVTAIFQSEERHFGLRYSSVKEEFKGKKFLKKKVFRLAETKPRFNPSERTELARDCIVNGAGSTPDQLAALAQAKLDFVEDIFEISLRFRCKAFASIVDVDAEPFDSPGILRKDYAYLFERFFYFLEDRGPSAQGAIVFDEIEKTKSKILLEQMEAYFLKTAKGRQRSSQVIPQPFFVHSDLTTIVQVADLIAYTISWGYRRSSRLTKPARPELEKYAEQVDALGYLSRREVDGNPNFVIRSFAPILDLRGILERNGPVQ